MRSSIVLATASMIGLLASAAWLSDRSDQDTVRQPIEFDHAVHAKENVSCDDCHSKADEGPHATFPSLDQCLLCHKEADEETTEPAEDAAAAAQGEPAAPERLARLARTLRSYADAGEGVPWVTVNRLVGHVYFSHVAHVRFGEMKCEECHGDMASAARPPERSQVEDLTMARCMECHAERGASNDCLTCHK